MECGAPLEEDIEGDEIAILDVQVLRGRKVAVGDELIGIDVVDDRRELREQRPNRFSPYPSDDVGWYLVSDAYSEDRRVAYYAPREDGGRIPSRFADYLAVGSATAKGVSPILVVEPNQDPQAILARCLHHVRGRRGVSTHDGKAGGGDGSEVFPQPAGFREHRAVPPLRKGAIRNTSELKTFVSRLELFPVDSNPPPDRQRSLGRRSNLAR